MGLMEFQDITVKELIYISNLISVADFAME